MSKQKQRLIWPLKPNKVGFILLICSLNNFLTVHDKQSQAGPGGCFDPTLHEQNRRGSKEDMPSAEEAAAASEDKHRDLAHKHTTHRHLVPVGGWGWGSWGVSVSHHSVSYYPAICLSPPDTQRAARPGQTHWSRGKYFPWIAAATHRDSYSVHLAPAPLGVEVLLFQALWASHAFSKGKPCCNPLHYRHERRCKIQHLFVLFETCKIEKMIVTIAYFFPSNWSMLMAINRFGFYL